MSIHPELLELEKDLEDECWNWVTLWYAVLEIETGHPMKPSEALSLFVKRKSLIKEEWYRRNLPKSPK